MGRFHGTPGLVRLGLRRDRVRLPLWGVVFLVVALGTAGATVDLYPTVASRLAAATAIDASPALVALYGPVLDPRSLGALAMLKLVNLGAAMVAILTAMTTVRHSRAEEEAGAGDVGVNVADGVRHSDGDGADDREFEGLDRAGDGDVAGSGEIDVRHCDGAALNGEITRTGAVGAQLAIQRRDCNGA